MHLIRQVVVTIIRVKKARRRPTITAPKMLVAANVIPSNTKEVKTVPKIPVKNVLRFLQQPFLSGQESEEVRRVIPKYPIAIPNSTHKKAGVIVIVAVKRRKAARTPIIKLAITDFPVQLRVQPQLVVVI